MSTSVLSTVVDYVAPTPTGSSLAVQPARNEITERVRDETEMRVIGTEAPPPVDDPELRLPSRGSLAIMIGTNALLQLRQFSFFVTVSSAAVYAEYLGGSALFSGLTIGIPTVFSGLALIPLTKYDEGRYSRPLKIAYLASILGNNFTLSSYHRNPPRTTLASWLVLESLRIQCRPFIGGLLYKVAFQTTPGWVTAAFTLCFAIASMYLFQDLPKPHRLSNSNSVELAGSPTSPSSPAAAFNYTPYAAGNFIALGGIATLPFLLASVRYSPRFQDRTTLATGSAIGLTGLVLALALLATDRVVFGSFYVCWVLVALGFNLASTCTLSLLSKQMPNAWNGRTSIAIQYSNYCGG
ncbi:hypothetical protein B0H13DRAFT_2496163 [Mycena leptocephala]|nr:hypothetical protein B0H13DRAFT_2496163 [Mycena leptocephala]